MNWYLIGFLITVGLFVLVALIQTLYHLYYWTGDDSAPFGDWISHLLTTDEVDVCIIHPSDVLDPQVLSIYFLCFLLVPPAWPAALAAIISIGGAFYMRTYRRKTKKRNRHGKNS